jgi:hypothetical protein
MADEVKPATLEPANDAELQGIAAALIGEHHAGLADAAIRYFWALSRPLSFWGRTKVASEEVWWLSGGMEEGQGCDIIIQLNEDLWKKLTALGRRGLVDVLLGFARRKEGGKTEMSTSEGTRLLYEVAKPTLGLDPDIIARNPGFVQEVAELKRLWKALSDPNQYELDLRSPAPAEEEEEGGAVAGAGALPDPEPHFYYKDFHFQDGHGTEKVTMRFTEADHRPSSLAGVYIHPDTPPKTGLPEMVNKSTYEYDTTAEAIAAYRAALEDQLDENQRDVRSRGLSAAAGLDVPEEAEEEVEAPAAGGAALAIDGERGGEEDEEEGELVDAGAGAEVVPMRGRRG